MNEHDEEPSSHLFQHRAVMMRPGVSMVADIVGDDIRLAGCSILRIRWTDAGCRIDESPMCWHADFWCRLLRSSD